MGTKSISSLDIDHVTKMKIGDICIYKGKPIFINNGGYRLDHRKHLYWDFLYIKKYGSFGNSSGDYDDLHGKFRVLKKSEYRINVKINLKL